MPEPNLTDSVVMLENAVHEKAQPADLPASAISEGTEATVVASKNVWLDESGIGGSTPEQGKLLAVRWCAWPSATATGCSWY